MSGFLLSGCCGCAGKQCVTHRDEFASYYNLLRYQLADTPGGSTPVAVDGWDPGVSVSLDGEGSFTVDIAAPTAALEVGSSITSLGSGAAAGVTVRRADSSDNISLWWLGGTSWELRQGSAVLESIAHAAGAFKLALKTPLDPTTDVEVWIGGSLVHTEAAVAFVAPSELWHVGLITEGEATFDYLETTPCPKIIDCEPPGGCLATVGTEVPPVAPVVWSMSVPAIGDDGEDLVECAPFGDDDFVLIHTWASVGYDYFETNQWQHPIQTIQSLDPFPGETEVYPSGCEWIAVIPSFDHRVFECSGEVPPAVPAGKLPVKWVTCIFGDSAENHPTAAGTIGPAWMLTLQYRNVGSMLAPDMEYRVWLSKQDGIGSTADYLGAWVKYAAADVISGTFVLSLVQNIGCTLPATITVTAGGEDAIARRVLECWEVACEPPVTPQPGQAYCMIVTLVDEADTPITYSVPMDVGYNETTGSWEWAGFIASWEHPTCGTMDASSYKIHCVELAEGASKQWVLDITTDNGTSRIVLSDDPGFGPVFDGTADVLCPAETWDVFAIFPAAQEPETDIFGCEDTTCQLEGYCISGVASCDTGTCAQNSFGNFLVATSANPPGVSSKIGDAFTGPYPVVFPAGYKVWLWKDGGGIHLGVYNGTTLIEEATPLDIDCDQGDKTFGLSDVTFACCSGFGGVTLTLTPCGGPIVHV